MTTRLPHLRFLLVASPLLLASLVAACSSDDPTPVTPGPGGADSGVDAFVEGDAHTSPSPREAGPDAPADTGPAYCPTGAPITLASKVGELPAGEAAEAGAPDAGTGEASAPDAGPADAAPSDSGPGSDSGVDSGHDAGTPAPHAKLQIVAASLKLPAIRICFAQGVQDDGSDATVAALPALPDAVVATQPYPGILRGQGVTFPDITDLSGIAITAYVVDASKISGISAAQGVAEKTCTDLLGPDGKSGTLKAGADYFALPTVPHGTFANGSTHLVAPFDCDKTSTGPGACAGAMGVLVKALDATGKAHDPKTIGVAVANASTGVSDLTPSFACQSLGDLPAFGDLAPQAVVDLADPKSELWFDAKVAGAKLRSSPEAFATIAAASPQPFLAGASYTFVLVGDPAADAATLPDGTANPKFDGKGLHFVALDNDPAVKRLGQ